MTNELHQMVGRIDERTELMMKSMEEFKRHTEKHDERITAIEGIVKYGLGIVAAVSFMLSFFVSKIAVALGIK